MAMFEHVHWANLRILEIMKTIEEQKHEAKLLFSHILLAEEVWIRRINGGDSSPQAIWNELSVEECCKLVERNKQHFSELLAVLTEEDAERIIHYKNSTGTAFTTSIRDILTHVALHGQYHRGQINRSLRQGGREPINVDFIMYIR